MVVQFDVTDKLLNTKRSVRAEKTSQKATLFPNKKTNHKLSLVVFFNARQQKIKSTL